MADCYELSDGESLALDREAIDPSVRSPATASGSDGGSSATTDTKGTLGFNSRSDGGSSSPFGEPAELLGKEARPAEAITGGGVGLSFLGSSVLVGATGSLGTDTSLAGLVEGKSGSATVVGSASVGRAVGVGSSTTAGANVLGGSKTARVGFLIGSVYLPIYANAYVWISREYAHRGNNN